jgi:hypothetical protein
MARHRRAERICDHKKERLTPVRAPRIVPLCSPNEDLSASKAAETATTLFLNGMPEREGFEPSVPVLAQYNGLSTCCRSGSYA